MIQKIQKINENKLIFKIDKQINKSLARLTEKRRKTQIKSETKKEMSQRLPQKYKGSSELLKTIICQ